MRFIYLPIVVLSLSACDAESKRVLHEITAVSEAEVLDYKTKETSTIDLDGETVEVTRYEGIDKKTGKLFVVFYQGKYQGQSFECQGSKEACIPKIREIRDNKGPDGP